jgi:NAD(P)H-hydrate epimerase
MAAKAAVRSGAGLVSVLTPRSVAHVVVGLVPEAMVNGAAANDYGSLAADCLDGWKELSERFDAVMIGPGMTCQRDGAEVIRQLVGDFEGPLVMDADALNLIAETPEIARGAAERLVITPHPGEMARLLKIKTADVQDDRLGAAREAARRFGAVTVLKGAGTVIADSDNIPRVNLTGNPGMARGGMGDVLAGLIAGLVGQGLALSSAAAAGVWIHGRAGDLAAARGSQYSISPLDLIDTFGTVFRDLSSH